VEKGKAKKWWEAKVGVQDVGGKNTTIGWEWRGGVGGGAGTGTQQGRVKGRASRGEERQGGDNIDSNDGRRPAKCAR